MLSIRDLKQNFDEKVVLKGINLEVEVGDVIVLIGPSGCGKSTILRDINQLNDITGGEVWYNDKLISNVDPYLHDDIILVSNTYKKLIKKDNSIDAFKKIKEEKLLKHNEGKNFKKIIKEYKNNNGLSIVLARQKIGMVFQHFNLFNNLTILENLILAPVQNKIMSKEEATKKAISLLDRIGLLEKKDQYPKVLSGGQKQRIAIIRSLCMNPDVILFDEPTSALDPEMVVEVLDLMRDLAMQKMTMIIVTHEMAFARQIATKIAYVDEGKILEIGTPTDIFDNPRNESLKHFLSKVL